MDTMTPFVSAVASIARQRAIQAADDAGRPVPTEEELKKIGDEADRVNTFGVGYQTDRSGNPIPVGVGAPGRETANRYASIRRYEGQAAYEKAVREIYKRDPQRAKALNLPEPPRVGAA